MVREESKSEIKNDGGAKIKNGKIITENENYEEFTSTQIKNHNNIVREVFPAQNNELNPITEEQHPISNLQDTEKAPILNIEVISSSTDPKGTLLQINAKGLVNSQRNANDGISYFGYEEGNKVNTLDYIITPKEEARDCLDERFFGKHFQIKYEPSDSKYYLKDLGHGFGTFIKISSLVQIKNNLLINIGENYIVFTLGQEEDTVMTKLNSPDKEDYDNMINIKVFSGNVRQDVLSFTPKKSPFTLGRSPDCEILIDDSMLSRVHCTISFKGGYWYIMDGSIIDEDEVRKSTNGTWVYAFEDMEITEQMTFKANHNLFICSFGQNDIQE